MCRGESPVGGKLNAHTVLIGKHEENDQLEDMCVDWGYFKQHQPVGHSGRDVKRSL
jgi:hypothetical protein